MSRLPTLPKTAIALYALGCVVALVCLIDTTAFTITGFFFVGLGSFGLGSLAYAKVVWDDLHAHGVL